MGGEMFQTSLTGYREWEQKIPRCARNLPISKLSSL